MSSKKRGERDSHCVEFPSHNNPLPYNYFSENVIIAAHKLSHALKNPAPQAPFSKFGDSQMVAIEKLLDIFPKLADNLHQGADSPQYQTVTKSASIPHKARTNITRPIPSEQTNIIEDDDGKRSKSFRQKVHMSPSGPHIILSEAPIQPQRVQPAQPPRVDTEGPSSNLISRGKKILLPTLH